MGPRLLIVVWIREARCCFSPLEAFDGSGAFYRDRRQLYDATSREIFHQVMDYSMPRSAWASISLDPTNNDLTHLKSWLWGCQTRSHDLGFESRFGARVPGQHLLGSQSWWSWFFFSVLLLLPFLASKAFKVWPMPWMRRHGEFGCGLPTIMQLIKNEKFQAKTRINHPNLFVYRLMSLMNPVMTGYQVAWPLLSTGLGRTWRNDVTMTKRSH